MNLNNHIITKASGKILISGGYGVLQQDNFGLCLSVANSFYCICKQVSMSKENQIEVQSSQISQKWLYNWSQNKITQKNCKQNSFVEAALEVTLNYLRQTSIGKICLELIFWRDFISNSDATDSSQFPIYKAGYTKTGLGSSACVIVCIVKCIILIFNPKIKQENQEYFDRLTNVLSQIANLRAQKKIGSNFDISTAIYGTHLYKNILPHKIVIEKVVQQKQICKLLQIDPYIKKVPKPSFQIHSYLIDVEKGADTRTMVRSFLSVLKNQDSKIQAQFFGQSKRITLQLYEALISSDIIKCKQINKEHRKLQQKYSLITKVPIQPSDITPIIDEINEIQACIYCICPGSGGYDAIFVLSSMKIQDKLKNVLNVRSVKQILLNFESNETDISQEEVEKIEFYSKKKLT